MAWVTPRPPKDRWHQLQDEINWSNMRASDKSVFRYLLSKADFGTALMNEDPRFTPDRDKIRREISISKRQVTYAIRHLERHGWIRVTGTAKNGRTAPGRKLAYTLSIGDRCDCTGRAHAPGTGATGYGQRVQPETVTGATFGHRSGATNGCNAAGQNRRQNRGITEEEEEGPYLPEPVACPRHRTTWGPHPHCLDCNARLTEAVGT